MSASTAQGGHNQASECAGDRLVAYGVTGDRELSIVKAQARSGSGGQMSSSREIPKDGRHHAEERYKRQGFAHKTSLMASRSVT